MSESPLLEVEDLSVSFPGRGGITRAVRNATFSLGRERLGIVGESGSGKSTAGRALLGLVLPPGIVTAKRMNFAGQDLIKLRDADWQALRGRRISMVMQDPKYSLNPVIKVGDQVQEASSCTTARRPRTPAAGRWRCLTPSRYVTPIWSITSIRTNFPVAWASGR